MAAHSTQSLGRRLRRAILRHHPDVLFVQPLPDDCLQRALADTTETNP